ncbi:acetyl/propionyl/methylcrotonyl-CoA carboxylase subunit alpha [Nocardioides antri]|uniref:Biotin/lipoyl-binding protein n=1 Tax=Nocardioides antri TaxID=2607659 RepID=A0A5B1M120_9ACTN|nr:biotin carboxylase N-terminal domain-containing protein [Nocardioides antri]KAA1426845.1 biotin/lipoyl-binding protein [Nocardioides antri]
MQRVLVANRAEIASRVFRTCRRLGLSTVAVFSDADSELPYVEEAALAVRLPGNTPGETYLRADLILDAAARTGATAIHPGYGFLSENADFARAVAEAGLAWIGPSPESIEQMGSKIESKKLMGAAGVPVLTAPEAPTEGDLPLLVKASAGGGGRGMRVVRSLDALPVEIAAAEAEAASAFGDGTVFVEPYVESGRHVEVQVVGHPTGMLIYGERDCSVQRRHQKIVEEAPAPALPEATRKAMHDAARAAAEAIDYRGAGTVEFLYDAARDSFWFLEMNTRLQVEHPVTEEVYGVDLVQLQLESAGVIAAGEPAVGEPNGAAIEVRLYAEDPAADYAPQVGTMTRFEFPEVEGLRVEAGFASGSTVSPFYDAMLAKLIVAAPTREDAARRLISVLRRARVHGLRTNREQLVAVLSDPRFVAGEVTTALLANGPMVTEEAADGAESPQESQEHRLVRLAGSLALVTAAKAASPVQSRIPIGYRNVVSQPQRTDYADGTSATWWGERSGFRIEGGRVVSASPTTVVFEVDGVRSRYDVAISGNRIDVDGPAGHVALEVEPRFVDPATQVAEGSLLAPMPGSVVAVHAQVGDVVAEGRPILVMEAMKMQHTITAPYSGTVTELAATTGQQVEAGTVLAVVTADTTDSESEED